MLQSLQVTLPLVGMIIFRTKMNRKDLQAYFYTLHSVRWNKSSLC